MLSVTVRFVILISAILFVCLRVQAVWNARRKTACNLDMYLFFFWAVRLSFANWAMQFNTVMFSHLERLTSLGLLTFKGICALMIERGVCDPGLVICRTEHVQEMCDQTCWHCLYDRVLLFHSSGRAPASRDSPKYTERVYTEDNLLLIFSIGKCIFVLPASNLFKAHGFNFRELSLMTKWFVFCVF